MKTLILVLPFLFLLHSAKAQTSTTVTTTSSSSSACCVTLYQDIDFGGPRQTIDCSIPDLTAIGWNDRISSILCGGKTITVYEHANFQGQSRTITDQFNVTGDGDFWNDRISSIIIR